MNHRPTHGGNRAWAAAIAGCQPEEILDFSASINPLGMPTSVGEAIQTHLSDLHAYPDPEYRALRQALAEHHCLDPEWILPGNGAAELLTWAGFEFSGYEETHLFVPAFSDYVRCLKTFGVKIVRHCLMGGSPPAPLKKGGVGETSFLMEGSPPTPLKKGGEEKTPSLPLSPSPPQRFSLPEVDAKPNSGVIINSPHNPTGMLFKRESVLKQLEQFALGVVDEAFMDFLPDCLQESVINSIDRYPNGVILRSLTKFYSLPGLRIGYAIAHPDRIQKWQQWRDPWSVNALAEVVAIAVLKDKEFQQKTLNWLTEAKPKFYQGLQAIPGLTPLPGAANYLLVQTDYPADRLQATLLKNRKILIRDCLSFPELGDRYFRVAVRLEAENQRLLDALREVLG